MHWGHHIPFSLDPVALLGTCKLVDVLQMLKVLSFWRKSFALVASILWHKFACYFCSYYSCYPWMIQSKCLEGQLTSYYSSNPSVFHLEGKRLQAFCWFKKNKWPKNGLKPLWKHAKISTCRTCSFWCRLGCGLPEEAVEGLWDVEIPLSGCLQSAILLQQEGRWKLSVSLWAFCESENESAQEEMKTSEWNQAS